MTIGEAAALCRTYRPSRYTGEDLVRWLSAVDGLVWEELARTHEPVEPETFSGYDGETDPETQLLVPEPYAEDVYLNFLESRIDRENGEIAKYNVSSALFNAGYAAYADYVNRTRKPKRPIRRFRT